MTWAELRGRLNAALADDAELIVVHVEIAWHGTTGSEAIEIHWNEDSA